jgi:hypothetical protein
MPNISSQFKLPEGEYSLGFIMTLAMAGYLDLTTPEELTYWLENDKTHIFIYGTLFNRVRKAREQRDKYV